MLDSKTETSGLKTEPFLISRLRWDVPCYEVEVKGESREALKAFVEELKEKGKPISVIIGAGANTKEILHVGERKGGLIIAVDNNFPPHDTPPIIGKVKKPFEVYLLRENSLNLPQGFADFAQVISPRYKEWQAPIESAFSSLKEHGQFLFVIDKITGRDDNQIFDLVVKHTHSGNRFRRRHLLPSQYNASPEYPPSGNISENATEGVTFVIVFEGRKK